MLHLPLHPPFPALGSSRSDTVFARGLWTMDGAGGYTVLFSSTQEMKFSPFLHTPSDRSCSPFSSVFML